MATLQQAIPIELIPLSFVGSPYGYAALLDDDGNEQPITDSMIRLACEQDFDSLYAHLPQRSSPPDQNV